MKQKNLTPTRKNMNSQNTIKNKIPVLVSKLLVFTLSTTTLAAPSNLISTKVNYSLTSLQSRMLEKPLSASKASKEEIIQKYGLVRLWPLNSDTAIADDRILGRSLMNTSFRVKPLYCGNNTYAMFDSKSMIKSDESLLFQEYFDENKPSSLGTDVFKVKKALSKASEWFPNYIPPISSDQKYGVKESLLEKHKDKINFSSSMVTVDKKDNHYYLKDSDYTIGGWFKPQRFTESNFGQDRMTLFTKKMTNLNGTAAITEWEVFIVGNVIHFNNYRDNSQPVAIKYLTTEEAELFRIKNQYYYGIYDYYDDVVEASQNVAPSIDRYLLPPILPKEKNTIRKPIPITHTTPVTPPPGARGPITIPKASAPPYLVIPPTGKEHISDVDLKTFWHATTLGNCYSCQVEGQKSDIWHYISFSVHLNDPLGPYVDFWIIMDPNPGYFKSTATFLSHAKHLRWEIDKQILSQPALNPFKNGILVERECSKTSPEDFKKGSCLKSVLEVGSIDQKTAYSGYMRGVYLSKKALREKEILDLAAQFYPDDSTGFCTYNHSPRN